MNMHSMDAQSGQAQERMPREKPPHSNITGDEQAQSRRRKSVFVHREAHCVAEHRYDRALAGRIDKEKEIRSPGHTSFAKLDVCEGALEDAREALDAACLYAQWRKQLLRKVHGQQATWQQVSKQRRECIHVDFAEHRSQHVGD